MATLQEIYDVRYTSGTLRQRVTGAILLAANDILSSGTETEIRKIWARAAMSNPEAKVDAFLIKCALNPTIAAAGDNATDSDIQFVVIASIDLLNEDGTTN